MRAWSVRAIAAAALGLIAVMGPGAGAEPLPGSYGERATVMFALPAASTSGGAGDTIRGGCFFATIDQEILTNGINIGVIGDASAATNFTGAPTGATVTCFIAVNGAQALGTSRFTYSDRTGQGGEAGVDPIDFTASDIDSVTLCEGVTFADGMTIPLSCKPATEITVPPQVAFDALAPLETALDPSVCPVLASLGAVTGGGLGGVIDIGPTGDVSAPPLVGTGLDQIYDCPPYDF